MKKSLVGAIVMVLLTGCSGSKEIKNVCKSTKDGSGDFLTEVYATEDKVTKTKITGRIEFNDTSYKKVKEKDMEEFATDFKKQFKDFDGVEVKTTVEDESIEYTVTYDYEKADLDALQEAEYITLEKDGRSSLKTTLDGLKKQGMTCKEEK